LREDSSMPTGASTPEFAWAIVGPGRIAHQFAGAVTGLPATYVRSVYGRNADNADAFARQWPHQGQPPRVATSLDDLLADPDVHGVYVATPHAQHGEAVRASLRAGKAVLCEKPLVPNQAEGRQLVALARERKVFLMEALWTRFLPAYQVGAAWLREGRIGPVRAIQSSFCFSTPYDPASRMFAPALAGGALLDIGIYNLGVTRWALEMALGACPELEDLRAHAVLAPTGVDQRLSATLHLPGGIVSQFVCAFDTSGDNALAIMGERGVIRFAPLFSQATQVTLALQGQPVQVVEAPFRINGFEGEIEEALRCARAGWVESPQMPHAESLALLGWMDELRRQVGVRYPFE
jgi:predicted dehydrogenase